MKEIFRLIPPQYRRKCISVALLVPVKALLNLVGVAALLPVMMLVLQPEKLQSSAFGVYISRMGIAPGRSFAMLVVLLVIVLLVIKTILSLWITNYQNRFLLSLYKNLSSRMFVSLYSRGLIYVKNNNSSKLSFNIVGVCYNFVMGYLGGWMRLIGEVVFAICLLAALLIYSPYATLLSLGAFLPVMLLYILAVRRPLGNMSKKENDLRREQNKLLYEAFRGYSEVQINDAFPDIRERFEQGLDTISRYRVRTGLIQSIPSYLLELAVVLIVAVLMLFSVNASDPQSILFLSLFAVAMLKMLPTIRSIISSISALNVTEYTKEVISDINTRGEYTCPERAEEVEPMKFEREISVRNLSFRFDDADGYVLENLNLSIRKGERFGIMGRTGAGKTTLFNLLLGLYHPTEGGIYVDSQLLSPENMPSWHKLIGYVPQDVFIADASVLQNVALGVEPSKIDRQRVEEALRQASLEEFIAELPEGLDTRIGEAGSKISGGQRQRLGIARALYKKAEVLFFDEATSSLDSQTEAEVNKAISALSSEHKELTIIVISHRESTMEFCDRIFRI